MARFRSRRCGPVELDAIGVGSISTGLASESEAAGASLNQPECPVRQRNPGVASDRSVPAIGRFLVVAAPKSVGFPRCAAVPPVGSPKGAGAPWQRHAFDPNAERIGSSQPSEEDRHDGYVDQKRAEPERRSPHSEASSELAPNPTGKNNLVSAFIRSKSAPRCSASPFSAAGRRARLSAGCCARQDTAHA